MIVRVRFMCVGASLRVCVRHLIVTISYGTPPLPPFLVWQISGFFTSIQIQNKTHRTKYNNIQNTHIHAQGRHSLLDLHCNKSTWIVYANYRALLTVSR